MAWAFYRLCGADALSSPQVTLITPQFFLWCQIAALWATASYGVAADPVPEDVEPGHDFDWRRWALSLVLRAGAALILAAVMSRSFLVSFGMLIGVGLLPCLRCKLPTRWTTGLEVGFPAFFLLYTFWVIDTFSLTLRWGILTLPLPTGHISAICILFSLLLLVVRGGTYMVKGLLKLADVLPEKNQKVDEEEVNRGRLIGNVERLILTIVTAGGSYAALGFLVAAKGLVRAKEFEEAESKNNRDFTEYFLIGSLASVLIALCAGLIMRFVLLALWPELLSLQMQSS